MLLENRVCVVTGGASARGIGRAVAGIFAEHGAKIVILDLDGAGASVGAAEMPRGEGHKGFACDVTDRDGCLDLLSRIHGEFGRIDVVVNSAGIAEPAAFTSILPKSYDAMMDVNLRGTFHICQASIPWMAAAKSGSIINISSVAAQRGGGIFGGSHYAAAKGGVLSLTKALAREFGPQGVRANVICPSLVETAIHGDGLSAERRQQIVAGVPLGRVGQPRDIAGACLFLASDLAAYVTGVELDVNGGSHIH